ncbi:MAG TPA: type II secretion system protein GspL [Methylibium sp.]|uniref:type II secretion system protein GspL n=1 Tax=Methylibium sp. TaxID=2067992 RepID=UPI002DBE16E5|nr:type II secretion system protein GspL [Methylibium sp.]HEU4459200.1 type II secretion system protein GspL [Methylibium sp.]
MATLVVLLPPRPRLRAGGGAPASAAERELAYALSTDGLTAQRQGHAAAALLPKADQVVAMVAASDVSWHRIVCPKAPAARMAAALAGVLEDAMLEDSAQLHLALAPGVKGGETTWVCATDRAWLTAELAALERAGLHVDRVVPAAWPDEPPCGHFFETGDSADPAGAVELALVWAHADGVAQWPLRGGLARALLPQPLPSDARFTATPAVAAPAERWLGARVRVLSPAEHALQAARSLWNLRQFGLAPRHRGLAALREGWRRFRGSAWRPVHVGLAALLAVQLFGLNLYAWQQRSTLEAKRRSMSELLLAAHPQVKVVLDAPVQMQRETDTLRAAAGRPGEADFEAALQAAALGWPAYQPVQTLSYENGRLTLAVPGWSEVQISAFRDAVRAAGWDVEAADGRLTLSRASTAGPRA